MKILTEVFYLQNKKVEDKNLEIQDIIFDNM